MLIKQMLYGAGVITLLGLGGCASDTPAEIAQGHGKLALYVEVDPSVTDAVPQSRSGQDFKVPDASELNLKLTKNDGSYSKAWGSVTDFPVDQQFSTGAYTLEAFYGAMDFEGFDSPYFYGVADLNVVEGASTDVTVTATLANTMVSVDYTDAFRKYFTEYSAQVHTTGGDYITFESDEERPVYLRPGDVSLSVSFTKQNGLSASVEAAEFQALPRHHYHITLDVNDGQTGDMVLQVLFDDSIVAEDVDIDISDAVLLMPGPTATPQGYVNDETVSITEGEVASQTIATLNAPAGLRSVILTTQSDELLTRGFPAEIDLMKATQQQQELLASYGLDIKGLFNKPDKMATVDFSGVFSHINTSGDHSFTLKAVDKLGKTHEPLTLKAATKLVNINILFLPEIKIDENEAEMTISYDGNNMSDNVTLQVQLENGDWIKPTVESITPSGDNFVIKFRVPSDNADFPVRLNYGSKTKATGTLKKTGVILSAAPGDMWATHVTFAVMKNKAVSLSDLSFYLSSDESNYSQTNNITVNSDGTVTVSGLTPATTLHVKASDTGALSGAYRSCAVTTEAAAQPQNGNMDTWSKDGGWSSGGAFANTVYKYFPASTATENVYWATRNSLTATKAAATVSALYNNYSGTYNVAGVNGTNCAEICTVGWSKTSANTFIAGGGICNHRSAGYLFMGTYEYDNATDTETFTYGRPFTSRPTALTFMYKFTNYNSENFKAYVVVENRDGGKVTELGRAELVSNENKSSFTAANLPIKYTNRKLKATHAYVVFISSTADSPGTKAVQGSKGAFQGYNDARYIGNILDVDNIEFTY